MRVLYFGDPQAAVGLIKDGIHLVGIIHGRRGGLGWQHLFKLMKSRSLAMPRWIRPDLNSPEIQAQLMCTQPDLIVSGFYPELIPEPILNLAPGVNVHPSDLPQWRGPDPVVHTILSGQETSAICVHALTAELDSGPVFKRMEVKVPRRADAGTLSLVLEEQGAALLVSVVKAWCTSGPIRGLDQVGEPTWAPQYTDEWWEIDWRRSAIEVDRFVRAAHPYPGAFTGIGNELLVIQKASVAAAGAFEVLTPGTPYVRKGELFIRCGQDALAIEWLKLGRRKLRGTEFADLLQ